PRTAGTQVLVLGLDGAGKTSLLHCFATGSLEQDVSPTQGFNAVSINKEELQIEFLEIGGMEKLRDYWRMYLCKARVLVFVVDSSDPERFPLAKRLLHQLLSADPCLPLVLLANKQDVSGARGITDLYEALDLGNVGDGHRLSVIGTQVKKGKSEANAGVQDARDLIIEMMILTWGNQESIRPLSRSALQAVPSPRIKALAQPKKDFSFQIQLSSPHSFLCEHDCPIWHVSPSVRNVVVSPRILQLANPKTNHPNFTSNRQNVQTFISYAAQTAKMTSRLEQLSLPKLRKNRHFYDPGRPERPIRTVSRVARNATASARIQALSTPKALSKDYIPPREPTWHP
ncbi:hypothetical protein QQF64_006869, partial [Cirrhinus molitorella]